MINLGLTPTQQRSYNRAIVDSRRMYIRVQIYDQNEKAVSDLTVPERRVLTGQVVVDTTQPIWRSLNVSVLDPKHRLYLDPDSPAAEALFPTEMVRVVRYDYVKELSRYVACPMFFGVISRFDRQGNTAYIEALGKEVFNVDPALMWESLTIKKGTKVTTAIRTILGKNGETKFDLPELSARTPKTLSFTPHNQAWVEARRLARSVNYQLFYDGRGYAKMRKLPRHALWTFTTVEGQGYKPHLISEASVSYTFEDLRNTIEVLGPQPTEKSGKERIRYVAYPRRSDPLSPWSMAHNGEPRYLVETIENSDIKRVSQAKEIAEDRLDDALSLNREVSFDCLPIPHLEEGDYVALKMADDTITWRMSRFSLPLVSSGVMNIGENRRNRVLRRRRRHRPV